MLKILIRKEEITCLKEDQILPSNMSDKNNENLLVAGISLSLLAAMTLLFRQKQKQLDKTVAQKQQSHVSNSLAPVASPVNTSSRKTVNFAVQPSLEVKKPPRDPHHHHYFANDTSTKQIAKDEGYYFHEEKEELDPEPSQYLHSLASSYKSEGEDGDLGYSPDVEKFPSFSRSPSFFEPNDGVGLNLGIDETHSDNTPTWTSIGLEQPMVIAMVGLPARGKSYLVKMIMRYLKWIGFDCRMFNVGSYRRQVGLAAADSSFFDPNNSKSSNLREELAMAVQSAMYIWLHETNEEKRRVAIFDATNTTKDRRLALIHRARQENVFLLFVESICDDEKVLQKNYELKLQNDDYKHMDIQLARKDFLARVQAYEKVYQTIEDQEDEGNIAYIKVINVGTKMITRNCHGFLPSQVAFYLQNVHIHPRKIYLTLISESIESQFGLNRMAGGESGELSPAGLEYSHNLANYISYEQHVRLTEDGRDVVVLTGTTNIHHQSVQSLKKRQYRVYHTPILNELRGGDLHGQSKQLIKVTVYLL